MTAPDASNLHPIPGQPRVVLLKPLVSSPLADGSMADLAAVAARLG